MTLLAQCITRGRLAKSALPLTGVFYSSRRFNTDKKISFTSDDVNGSDLKHPYWESSGPDDFGLMDELQEFGGDIDFDLPEGDKEILKNEWTK
ncbi:hypothetical protein XU18_0427 [Perkinsela sp. CCAP 1560/4]|nr:hypothetical protein XU18_0427 [Perkinsela sp. CCAP 1560/4]|eukprot:KNH09742.1 hypothetical protein XU18_0427 [Perkinsela sp. CCAP 1560/4]